MVQLSFFESISDKAGMLLPTVYLPILEECTAPSLRDPTEEHVHFLAEKCSISPDDIGEVLRAIRRRFSDDDPRVKALTVRVLGSLTCMGPALFHLELARHKGILKELEDIACTDEFQDAWLNARKEARTLILNFSVWFLRYPNPECHILTTLVTDVKQRSGPNSFAGISSDRTVQLKLPLARLPSEQSSRVPSTRVPGRSGPPSATTSSTAPAPAAAGSRTRRPHTVDAIPVDLPTEESISSMLDTCATLSEYLPNAERDEHQALSMKDDVLVSFYHKIQSQYSYIALLLSSDIEELDRDVLRAVLHSQEELMAQVEEGRKPKPPVEGLSAAGQQAPSRGTGASPPVVSAPPPPTHWPRAAADVEATTAKEEEVTPSPAASELTNPPSSAVSGGRADVLDELFSSQPENSAAPVDAEQPQQEAPSSAAADEEEDDFDAFLEKEMEGQ